jgi:hypothetical protein
MLCPVNKQCPALMELTLFRLPGALNKGCLRLT